MELFRAMCSRGAYCSAVHVGCTGGAAEGICSVTSVLVCGAGELAMVLELMAGDKGSWNTEVA